MGAISYAIGSAGYRAGIEVLKSIKGSVDEGEVLLVAGPSGSGKTTLLLALTGVLTNLLEGYVHGSVRLADINPLDPSEFIKVPKLIGAVLQDPDKQLAMPTPWDEVAFTLENLGYSDDEIDRVVGRVLSRFGLLEKAYQHVEDLSGGEKRRLTFASAVVHEPKLILLDEPSASVDPWGIREVKRFIRELRDRGSAIIIVEHKIKYFTDEASRIEVMVNGRIEKSIMPDELSDEKVSSKLMDMGVDTRIPPVREHPREYGKVVLKTESLTVGYEEEKPLIKDASFEVRKGEIVAIIGPNGSGKTTLLKTLVGAIKPLGGSIEIEGVDVRRIGRSRLYKSLFYVPQQPDYLFMKTSLEAEVREVSRRTGVSVNNVMETIPWARGLESHSPYRLSFGQRRWLSIVIGWCYSPRILMLDEPTAGLDYRLFTMLRRLIEMLRGKGTSFIIATHDPRVVAEIADRALVIEGGKLYEIDRFKAVMMLESVAGVMY